MAATYDFTIDCAQDFIPDIDVERKNSDTGEMEAYAGISGVTLLISAVRGSQTAIHANLSKSASERTNGLGGRIGTVDVAEGQTPQLTVPPQPFG